MSMRFEYNCRFKDLQEMVGIDFIDRLHHHKTFADLSELIELYQVDGCIFIHNLPEYRTLVDPSFVERFYQDRTGYEVSENHVKLETIVEPAMTLVERMRFSVSYISALITLMKQSYPMYHFQIVFSYVSDEDFSIRFHVLRPGESPYPNMDLEQSEEALLVIGI